MPRDSYDHHDRIELDSRSDLTSGRPSGHNHLSAGGSDSRLSDDAPKHGRSLSMESDQDALGSVPLVQPSGISGALPSRSRSGEAQHAEEKHLGLIGSVALVVGAQIGSGIFSSPGVILASTSSMGASLLIWILGGVLAWTGASSYAELGSAIPVDGGSQAYLGYAYGPLASYLYTFTTVVAIKPGSAAIIALIFGEYGARLIYLILPLSTPATGQTANELTKAAPLDIPTWSIKVLACVAIVGSSVLSALNAKSGIKAAVALTSIKVASLVFVLLLGLFSLAKNGLGPNLGSVGWFEGTSDSLSAYAVALYSGLWAYDGWDNSNLVAGQMINAARDLPRCIHISLSTMIFLYILTNLAYFLVLPLDVISVTNTIALDFGHEVLGRAGGLVFTVVVGTSCFGALNGGVYTAARLIFAAAEESFLPAAFCALSSSRQTPVNAIGLNMILCMVFVILGGGFRSMVNFFGVICWAFYLATVSALLYLRVKEPQLSRPYRTWVITPITFCGVALFLLMMPVIAAPLQALAAFGFIAAGLPAYHLTMRYKGLSNPGGPDYLPLNMMARVRTWTPEVQIASLAIVARIGSCFCLVLLPWVFRIQSFDTSSSLAGGSALPQSATPAARGSFLRWDGMYFANIARKGYRFEQELAFFPLWPIVMRMGGWIVQILVSADGATMPLSIGNAVVGGTIISNLCFVLSSVMLYRCSLIAGLGNKLSFRSAVLFVFAPAPAVMSSPYTEQLFALSSFTGYWLLEGGLGRSRPTQLLGSLVLAVASGTRSLGVLGSLVVGWAVLLKPYLKRQLTPIQWLANLLWTAALCFVVFAPFGAFQYMAFQALCGSRTGIEPLAWCQRALPLAYSAVQEKYWDIGFLRYWKLAQVPNFALAGPVLLVCLYGLHAYSSSPSTVLRVLRARWTKSASHISTTTDINIFPHYVNHAVTTFVLIFSSHTQIALRVCSGMPLVWWTLARTCFEPDERPQQSQAGAKEVSDKAEGDRTVARQSVRMSQVGRVWVTWVCVWGCISFVLWSGFYPPA